MDHPRRLDRGQGRSDRAWRQRARTTTRRARHRCTSHARAPPNAGTSGRSAWPGAVGAGSLSKLRCDLAHSACFSGVVHRMTVTIPTPVLGAGMPIYANECRALRSIRPCAGPRIVHRRLWTIHPQPQVGLHRRRGPVHPRVEERDERGKEHTKGHQSA